MAGFKLYDLTQKEEIKNQIIAYADSLFPYHQIVPMDWSIPLNGFFYMKKRKDRFFSYSHSCAVSSPINGFVELCKLFPNNEKYALCLNSVN